MFLGHVGIIELLLSLESPASLLVFNDDGFAAIHLAVLSPDLTLVKIVALIFMMSLSCSSELHAAGSGATD
jgi:hypothetical protein